MTRKRYRVDLIADGAECDANYVRMHRLLPGLFDLDERSVTLPLPGQQGERTLTFRVTERCPYTTTINVRLE